MTIWQNLKEKAKSPVLWVSILAMIAFVAKRWCGYEIPGWDEFVDLFIALLAAFGIVNNPNSRNTI